MKKLDIEQIAKEDQDRWYADLRRTIEEMQQTAFEMGFEIKTIAIHDNWVKLIEPGKFGYGDRARIPAPDWIEIESDYGVTTINRKKT